MRSTAILGGIGLAGLVLLVLLWRLSAPASVAPARHEVPPEQVGRAPATLSAAEAPETAKTPPREDVSANAQRDAVAAVPAAAPTCRIRVIEAGSRAPVPDARVWLQREDSKVDSAAWRQAMARFNDVELALRDGHGVELELDERGEVRLPPPSRRLCVAAARGALHGEGALNPGDAECVIELRPFHSLEIEVVDRAGRPVEGAHVAFYRDEPDPIANQTTMRTGRDGRVSIPKLESQLLEGFTGPLHATLAAGAACAPQSLSFSLDALPAEPLRLVALDHASFVVQLTDPQGNELALDGACYVDLLLDSGTEPTQAQRASCSIYAPFLGGRATFECVGLGLTLEIDVAAEGHSTRWRVVPGPVAEGERLLVQMPIGEPFARVRGRVRGLEACFGDALVSEVRLSGHNEEKTAAFRVAVGNDGSFEDLLWGSHGLAALGGTWALKLTRPGKPRAEATVTPLVDEPANTLDLGEVVFQPAVALARLQVRDEDGKPVPSAVLEIRSSQGEEWLWSDEAGRCVVTEQVARLPMQARATHDAWLASAWQTIYVPGSEAEFVLRSGARVTGQLLLPSGVHHDELDVWLTFEPGGPGAEAQQATTSVLGGGAFVLAPCERGRATLTVHLAGVEVFERPGLVIAGDAELEPIDLRARLFPFQLSFELASGEPWSGGHLEVLEPDGEVSTWLEIGPSARALFLAPRASLDLWVAGRGALATRFEGVLNGDRLTLPRAPSLRLRLPQGIARPAPPLELLVRGSWNGDEDAEFEADDETDVQVAVVGADDTAWLRVPWPGTYELEWVVRHAGTGVGFAVAQDEPQNVEVTETGRVPVVEARLTREELAQALHEAGG